MFCCFGCVSAAVTLPSAFIERNKINSDETRNNSIRGHADFSNKYGAEISLVSERRWQVSKTFRLPHRVIFLQSSREFDSLYFSDFEKEDRLLCIYNLVVFDGVSTTEELKSSQREKCLLSSRWSCRGHWFFSLPQSYLSAVNSFLTLCYTHIWSLVSVASDGTLRQPTNRLRDHL